MTTPLADSGTTSTTSTTVLATPDASSSLVPSDGSRYVTPAAPAQSRIYVGIDIGYKQHVAAAIPVELFNPRTHKEGWKRVKTLSFSSDNAGFRQLGRYFQTFSADPNDFLALLEPTGGYYAMGVVMYLLNAGYKVLQVENSAVKWYREKIYGSETKSDVVDARVMARMGFLHEQVGEEFSIQPVQVTDPDASTLRVMVQDYIKLQKEIVRRQNQLQQVLALTFPELKTFFVDTTAGKAARAVLEQYLSPAELSKATAEELALVLRSVGAYGHAKRAEELRALAETSAELPMLTNNQWRQGWILKQLNTLLDAKQDLIEQLQRLTDAHPYTPIIESLPLKSPIWTASLIAVIGNIHRFKGYNEFKAYLGWYPQQAQSGSSVHSSRLASGGVRISRLVLGQMVAILLTPNFKGTAFREFYDRLVARGMKPNVAKGHMAGKIAVVLYGMLRTMQPYDEQKHRKALGLAAKQASSGSGTPAVDVTSEILDMSGDAGDIELPDTSPNGDYPPDPSI